VTRPDIRAGAIVALLALATVVASLTVAPGLIGAFGAGLGMLMLAIAVIDGRRLIIPDPLTAGAFALGLVNAVLTDSYAPLAAAGLALLRAAVLALAFLALRAGYRWLRGREGLGLGDVKLAGVAGVWLDWLMLPVAIEIAALAAIAAYLVRAWWRRRPLRAAGLLPFGLFLAPAIWLSWALQATLLGGP
jgi:leader peptidase (prepilin peptidase)/N-methyltransferase